VTAKNVVQNLRVVLAANQAAGLSGSFQVNDHAADYSTPQVLSAGDVESLDASGAAKLLAWELDTCPVCSDGQGSSTAILCCWVMGQAVRVNCPITADQPLVSQQQREEWSRNGSTAIAALAEHQRFLSALGFFSYLDEGDWKEEWHRDEDQQKFERQPILYVVAILKSSIFEIVDGAEHPAFGAFLNLSRLENDEPIQHGIRLRAPLFPLEASPADIVNSAAIEPDRIIQLADQWERCGRNYTIFTNTGEHQRRKSEGATIKFLVPGVIPFGHVTLLAARSGAGKSTLTHELAVAAGTPRVVGELPVEWLGIALSSEKTNGLAAFVSGEDGGDGLAVRVALLDPEHRADNLGNYTSSRTGYRGLLQKLAKLPSLRLVVIDPVRKFTEGSEDQSDNISEFFGDLEDLAATTGCAVIAVHHLAKNANPRSLNELRQAIRGSGVFVDRPRVVLGVYQVRGQAYIGIVKHNIPPGFGMLEGSIALDRDAATLRHLPASSPPSKRTDDLTPPSDVVTASGQVGEAIGVPEPGRLSGAIRRLIAEDKTVTRTGLKSPFGWRPIELEGCTRAGVDRELEALIAAGTIRVENGRLSV
jgi:AAA domain